MGLQESTSSIIDLKTYRKSRELNSKEYKFNREKDREVAIDLDENNYLEKCIEKLEDDRREQEKRLNDNMHQMEKRIVEERHLSEERMEKKFIEAMQSLEKTNNKIDSINDKIDNKIDSINNKIDGTNKWMIGTCIATILAVAAIAASVWFK
jgi:hypothetical protein